MDGDGLGTGPTPEKCSGAESTDTDDGGDIEAGHTELADSVVKSTFERIVIRLDAGEDVVVDVGDLPEQNPSRNEEKAFSYDLAAVGQ